MRAKKKVINQQLDKQTRRQRQTHRYPEELADNREEASNIHWLIIKAREFQKNIRFCFIDYAKAFDCMDHNKLWKILQDMGIPDHLICSWEISLQVKKQQLELDMEQQIGSKLGKEYVKAALSSCLFNLYAE